MGARRLGAYAAFAAGIVWAVSGVLAIVYRGVHEPGTREDLLVEGTFALGVSLTALAMVGLHATQRGRGGVLERSAFLLVVGMCAAQVVATVAALAGFRALEPIVLPAALVIVAGFLLYGIATWRAGVLPRWLAVGLAIFLPIGIALGLFGGNILVGAFWGAVGVVLWRGEANGTPPG